MEKVYWKCPDTLSPKDALSVISALMSGFSLMLNLGLLILLFFLKGRSRIFLFQLRTLNASAALYSFIRTCDGVIPRRLYYINPIFAPIMCHIWTSRYLAAVTYTFAVLILNFTVGNRAIQIVCRYQHSFSTSLFADLAYLGGMGLTSIICIIPRVFIMHWDGKYCLCRDTNLSYEALVFIYSEVFVRFGLTAIISVTILSISCYKIIDWVRNTPADQLSDTWNTLTLPGTTEEQLEAFSRPQGWLTASLCTVPLSVIFLTVSIYDTGHKFICAVGLCTIVATSPFYVLDRVLLELNLIVLPIVIIIYIPVLRELAMRSCLRLISLCVRSWNAPIDEQLDSRIP
nr:unnamed protein product [Spirometra erinaceieuropaei]